MKALTVVGCALVLVAILRSGAGIAQPDQAISVKDLVDPWGRAKEVLLSLAPALDTIGERDARSQLDHDLSRLDDELSALQSQEETVAIRIVSNPAFVYDVSLSSDQMSRQISLIGQSFDLLFSDLTVRQRSDVLAAQQSVESLRQALNDQNRLERDVIRAVGSGSKNEIQALAARWWAGAESVSSLREAVADARQRLSAIPGSRH
jgi:hypothetical protein